MKILAIDTTGHSTAVAFVKNGSEVIFNKKGPGFKDLKPVKEFWDNYSGVLADHHSRYLLDFIKKLFKNKDFKINKIDAIAVSAFSGVKDCVFAGKLTADILGGMINRPVIEVDHILAHHYSTWLGRDCTDFKFPILVFSASGSHSDLSIITSTKEHVALSDNVPTENSNGRIKYIGIGKLFMRLGRYLNTIKSYDNKIQDSFGMLLNMMQNGDVEAYDFKKHYRGALFDFDFEYTMTEIRAVINDKKDKDGRLDRRDAENIAASFQESFADIICDKIITAASLMQAKEVHIVGGISVNEHLENKLKSRLLEVFPDLILRYPKKKEYKLDNAAMIGCLAYYQKKNKIKFTGFRPIITK